MASLSGCGLTIPDKTLRALLGESYNKFFDSLTITFQPKIGAPIFTKMYATKYVGRIYSIVLPRSLIAKFAKYITIENKLAKVQYLSTALNVKLYPDQQIIIDHLLETKFTEENIISGNAVALLNLGAGKGKTMLSAGLIYSLQFKAIYIVPKIPLADQAVDDLKLALSCSIAKYTPQLAAKIAKGTAVLPDVLVIVINSALNHPELFANYSMAILDEVHAYCSRERRDIFKIATLPVCFGMSATTAERNDGTDIIAHKELGAVIYGESLLAPDESAPKFACEAHIINYYGDDEYVKTLTHEKTGLIFTHYMHEQAVADEKRMKLALNEIKTLYEWRGNAGEFHTIYVFAEELDALRKMRAMLVAEYGDDNLEMPEIGSLVGGAKTVAIENIKKSARIILTTYGFSGTGFSINRASAMLLLTSRKAQMKQILARIMRRGSDMNIPRIVIDIVDKRTCLCGQVKARRLAYDFYEMKIIEKNVFHRDL
jgi:superfamily II DNA or RNA helicase